jgi:hypothetical protein
MAWMMTHHLLTVTFLIVQSGKRGMLKGGKQACLVVSPQIPGLPGTVEIKPDSNLDKARSLDPKPVSLRRQHLQFL